MSDDQGIVRRLHNVGHYHYERGEEISAELHFEAADAIARLTLENEKLMSCVADVQAQMRRHHARAETAERERDEAREQAFCARMDGYEHAKEDYRERIITLEAELDEARAVLTWYADQFCEAPADCYYGGLSDEHCSGCRARAAAKGRRG